MRVLRRQKPILQLVWVYIAKEAAKAGERAAKTLQQLSTKVTTAARDAYAIISKKTTDAFEGTAETFFYFSKIAGLTAERILQQAIPSQLCNVVRTEQAARLPAEPQPPEPVLEIAQG